jgi:hypothetical protein
METVCDICETKISNGKNLSKHQKTEKCQNFKLLIQKHLIQYKQKMEIYENKLQSYEKENKTLKENIEFLEKSIENKDNLIKIIQEKSEEYRSIIEKVAVSGKNIDTNILDTNKNPDTFQFEIVLDKQQLNKVKFQDKPEDDFKNNSLKLKDNYQLEYREEDGYINITNLCKAGGKMFNNWNQNNKTKRFLEVFSSTTGIPVIELAKQEKGGNRNRHTWSHPQVAINIAQWISPEFDVMVSRWVYEIMLTGKVDIRNGKSTQELDKKNKELSKYKSRIKLLESKVLKRQKREVFENDKNVVYIVTTEYRESQGHYKIGKTQDLQNRLSTFNTTDKHEVIYHTSCRNKETMDILEKAIHNKLENCRVEPNREWFKSEEDADDFIKLIEDYKKLF